MEASWWESLTAAELAALRRRLLRDMQLEYGDRLKADVEDVVQDAFSVLFQRRYEVTGQDDGLYRFLRTVARHDALDRLRQRSRRRSKLSDIGAPVPTASSSAIPPLSTEERRRIWRVFCALDDLERLVLWSFAVEGTSIREIARRLSLNWHFVAGVIESALAKVQRGLSED